MRLRNAGSNEQAPLLCTGSQGTHCTSRERQGDLTGQPAHEDRLLDQPPPSRTRRPKAPDDHPTSSLALLPYFPRSLTCPTVATGTLLLVRMSELQQVPSARSRRGGRRPGHVTFAEPGYAGYFLYPQVGLALNGRVLIFPSSAARNLIPGL